MAKYVFVTGGVVSGLGKGITASSVALLLKSRGYKVFMQKFDPYINVDPGTMNPIQHGEVFVTKDGAETDLDLGHYERFINEELNQSSNVTSGRIYSSIIEKERKGEYLGSTVQMVPHVTNEIKSKIFEAASTSGADIVITEIGGTVGDLESDIFMESLRQVQYELGKENTFFIHTTLIPYIYGSNELKTKPTQNSIRDLRNRGISVNAIVCRTPMSLSDHIKGKIANYSNIDKENIIEAIDVKNVYRIPLNFKDQKIDEIVLKQFALETKKPNVKYWEDFVTSVENSIDEVEIALVGKYVELHDAYLSVSESLKIAGYKYNTKVKINWVDSEKLESQDVKEVLQSTSGIIVPGGFGTRGTEGKISAIKYARENNVPFLGICLGMQLAVIEFARNICGIKGANSKEFDKNTKEAVIDLMEEQKNIVNLGGTLRLGNYACKINKDTNIYKYYKQENILERHRHRFEFNNKYKKQLEGKGLVIAGINEEADLVEIVEYPKNDYFVACQFHPEFKSRPGIPHPLFDSFVNASIKKGK